MIRIALLFCLCAQLMGCKQAVLVDWTNETALDAGTKLGGCAVGDVDPDRKGDEIAVVAGDGSVYLVHALEDGWAQQKIGAATGEMIQCAIGDADPARKGLEVVAVGMKAGKEEDAGAGAAHIASRGPDGWSFDLLFEDTALIHGVCVGDIDPQRDGEEVLLVGFSRRATLAWREGDSWQTEVVGELPGDGKNALPYQGGAAVVCNDGAVVLVARKEGAWTVTELDRAEAGLARIGTDGERLVVARDDGALAILAAGEREEIHQESSKLRGAVLADLDPDLPGIEAATAGYGNTVTLLHQDGDAWKPRVLFEDTGRLHHLATGRIGPDGEVGLVTCGYSGLLTVIRRTTAQPE